MINKKLSTLAAAVLAASSAQAAFEMAFVAVDADGDTYVHNMGTYAAMEASTGTGGLTFDVSGVNSAIDAYSWTVVGTSSSSNVIAAPPGASGFTAYDDTGVVTTSIGAPSNVTIANNQAVNNEKAGLEAWLSTVSGLAGANDSVVIAGTSGDRYTSGQQAAFHDGRMQNTTAGFGTFQLNEFFHSANSNGLSAPAAGGLTIGLSFDGSTAAVPVPAAAWLFGSALAGLTVIRRRK
ncbi:MAG: hypothetical protein CL691_01815 [Cellvibrionales bacterium]|nr:hypothetical protein [Cellvibrionales bacterium]|tara:strand:+ start:1076 stop:1783 length:708 start_codon:yes stop_codon:yes gene_type:complete